MGKLLVNIAIGLAINYAISRAGRAASDIASRDITYEFAPINWRKDIRFKFVEGKITAFVTVRLRMLNQTLVAIYLNSYQAKISQEGTQLSTLSTTDNQIELLSGEPKIIATQFEVVAETFVDRIKNILGGSAQALAPIVIAGQLRFTNGFVLPITRTINFISVT